MKMIRRNERGVAMVTVILVGAAMTAVVSVAAFAGVQEFRTVTDDKKASAALSYAESGVDRFLQYMRLGSVSWNRLNTAGCEKPALPIPEGLVGNGTFDASLTVFNPYATTAADRFPPAACSTRASSPRDTGYFAISATGQHPAAKRIVQQVVAVTAIGLPIGFAAQSVNANGDADMSGVSIFSRGRIIGREKLDLAGLNPFYKLEDFWPNNSWPSGRSGTNSMPSGAHAVAGILLKANGSQPEFTTGQPKNCTANKTGGNTNSLWDGDGVNGGGPITSGCTGQVGYPPDSRFDQTDYNRIAPEQLDPYERAVLKEAAKTFGLYCYIPLSGSASCTRQGVGGLSMTTDVAPILASGTNNFVTYYEYQAGGNISNQNISWNSNVWVDGQPNGCSPDPDLNRSVVVVVENGGIRMSNNSKINGALLLDGDFDYTGTPYINGTIMARDLWVRGTGHFTLDPCWVQNMPGPFLSAETSNWSEIDR